MFANPFFIYIAAFGSALALYQVQWLVNYPAMTWGTLAFFALSFAFAGSFARLAQPAIPTMRRYRPGMVPAWAGPILLACFVVDIAPYGGIPLVDLIHGTFVYMSFKGVPSLHVVAVTLGSAFSVIRFCDFLYEDHLRRWRYLAEAFVPIIFLLLIVYRGPALIVLTSWAFAVVIWIGRIRLKHVLALAAVGVVLLLGAGKLGEMRNGDVSGFGEPRWGYPQTSAGKTALWFYVYATGPLANFQHAVATVEPAYDLKRIPEYIVSELLPDTISHRLLPRLGASPDRPIAEFTPHFNVSVIFSRSWLFFGWISVLSTFVVFIFAIYAYIDLIRVTPLAAPGLALLNTFVVYSLFDNMIAVTSISFQLVWPLLIGWLLLHFKSPDQGYETFTSAAARTAASRASSSAASSAFDATASGCGAGNTTVTSGNIASAGG
jgi:hypothetical protein